MCSHSTRASVGVASALAVSAECAAYEQAIARYDQANELLSGDPTEYRVDQARAAIAAGRRHIEAARERLG